MLADLETPSLSSFYSQILSQSPLSPPSSGFTSCKGAAFSQVLGVQKQQKRSMAPTFCFTVQEIRPHEDAEEIYDTQGVWHPPQAQGNNIPTGNKVAYRCDGENLEPMPLSEVPSSDSNTSLYGTTSVYVYQDAFHIINYDATQYSIGDGLEIAPMLSPISRSQSPASLPSFSRRGSEQQVRRGSEQQSRRGSEQQARRGSEQQAARRGSSQQPRRGSAQQAQDLQQQAFSLQLTRQLTPIQTSIEHQQQPYLPPWARLRFHHLPAQHGYRSFASPDGNQIRLQTQRPDQAWWARRLLPEAYWAPNKNWTHVHGRGGLNGELPLLLALVAFSVPAMYQETVFTECFRNGNWDFGFVRDVPHGRDDKRGIIISVYAGEDLGYSDHQALAQYEYGTPRTHIFA